MSPQPSPAPQVTASAPATMPGLAMPEVAERLETELAAPHLPSVPALPRRGHHGAQLGRATALLSELPAELTSYGWRLTQRPGADRQRAERQLNADVDAVADVRGAAAESGAHAEGAPGLVLHLLGPVSLAAQLAVPSGEKVLVDHGARRDVAASLAAGLGEHLAHVLRACQPSSLTVVLDEPDHSRVRAGAVPTVSGYRTIRSLPRDETRRMIGEVAAAVRAAGADRVLLDLGAPVAAEHLEDHLTYGDERVDGFGLPVTRLDTADWERTATLAEQGVEFLAALLHPGEVVGVDGAAPAAAPEVSTLADRLAEPWRRLGMAPSSLAAMLLAPFDAAHHHRLAEAREVEALRAATRVRDAAAALTDRMGR